MINHLKISSENSSLLRMVLICSIQSLSPWNSLPVSDPDIIQTRYSCLNNTSSSTNILLKYLSNHESMISSRELAFQLLQLLNIRVVNDAPKPSYACYEQEHLRQYLRKFRFFYLYYYLKVYPNDLSTLSIKKINKLAIRSLFLLHSF
jgi:hypothetical protein